VTLIAVSRWIETDPEGDAVGQPRFLNGAMLVETRLAPRELLQELFAIERAHDRKRPPGVRHAPRTLDLDLLVHGHSIVHEPDLTLPHPHMRERAFVLEPLAEIAPDLRIPAPTHQPASCVRDLWRALQSPHARTRAAEPQHAQQRSKRSEQP